MEHKPILQFVAGRGAARECERLSAPYGQRLCVFDRRVPVFTFVKAQEGEGDVLLCRFAAFLGACVAAPNEMDAILICDLLDRTDVARIEREACLLVEKLLCLKKDVLLAVECAQAYRLAAPVLQRAAASAGYEWRERHL
jgi:hypothetical protein